MKKNSKCHICKRKFLEGDGVYVIKTDNETPIKTGGKEELLLCPDCQTELMDRNPNYAAWYAMDTACLDEDLNSDGELDEYLDTCSYYTEFMND